MIHTNAGIDSEKSSHGILTTGSIINNPTIISAGAVAADGIERKSGEKNNATTKHIATENAVRLSDGEDGQILYGYVFRRGEELSECVSAFVDFLKDKLNALQRK